MVLNRTRMMEVERISLEKEENYKNKTASLQF
jgi:hypothetical protein